MFDWKPFSSLILEDANALDMLSVSATDVNLKLEKEPGKSDRVCRTCARKTSVAAEHIDRCIRTPILIENKMFKIY